MMRTPERGPALTVTTALYNDAVVVRVAGELDLATVSLLRAHLERARVLPEVSALIMDLSELVFCDSTGLGELVDAHRSSEAHGVRLVLSGVRRHLEQLLELTGLRSIFEVRSDPISALRAVSGSGDGLLSPSA
ncbi:STAS domain-containing protein [Planobispora siamensis]|uniref:Anti-sigma factor antagonist n=1 Tax=Planobispora siamensis TaxID=936338 RepID=A0A8J3SDD1_9ACTN|nr:STAS domain-containing protein [Planobispora siamensis]GIH91080.1 anti-sigma factor antagonist [Planobispora siamensis]